MKDYHDGKITISISDGFRLKADESSGYYFVRGGKDKWIVISVLPKAKFNHSFDALARLPAPDVMRVKTIHNRFAIGDKEGQAFSWKILDKNGNQYSEALEFFCQINESTVYIDMAWKLHGDYLELLKMVESLVIC